MDLKDLYRDVIVDHNKHPRNFGRLDPADAHADGHNPLCGDQLSITARLAGDKIDDVKFEGSGCAISVASASLMTEAVRGKSLAEFESLHARVHELLTQHAGYRPYVAGQVRRIVRRARVSRAREVRQPVLAHFAGGVAPRSQTYFHRMTENHHAWA
jgi:SUF system NifU family Fe-S assembly protein